MAGDTSEQTSSSSNVNEDEIIRSFAKELHLSEKEAREMWQKLAERHGGYEAAAELIKYISVIANQTASATRMLSTFQNAFKHGIGGEREPTDPNQATLRIGILEEPLTAQNLSAIITAITDLHARCWFIQQKRFTELMDYAQSRDPRFLKEANLRVGIMTHNSPALIDFLISSAGGITGAAALALALRSAIDAVVQAPLRFQATKLRNQREIQEQQIREKQAQLDQQIAAQRAEAENKDKEQERQIAAQKAQLDFERQQMLLDIEKRNLELEAKQQQFEIELKMLEFEKNRFKNMLEIATKMISQLQPDMDAGQQEMIIHSLVPPLLQLAATKGLLIASSQLPPSQESKGSSEDK
jgi:hypothetical protein